MNCDICGKNEAVIHIKQVSDDEERVLHLCETCAENKGIETDTENLEFSISNLLTGLVDIQSIARKANTKKVCPQCQMTLEKLKKQARLGCEECFHVFAEEIERLLKRMYGKIEHKGKYPSRYLKYREYISQIDRLTARLEELLKLEQYEEAAKIRDEIKELQEKAEVSAGVQHG